MQKYKKLNKRHKTGLFSQHKTKEFGTTTYRQISEKYVPTSLQKTVIIDIVIFIGNVFTFRNYKAQNFVHVVELTIGWYTLKLSFSIKLYGSN